MQQIIFAKLTDKPGLAACAVIKGESFHLTEVLLPTDHAQLPPLSASDAEDVYYHATQSGSDLEVAALVLSRRGYNAMCEYCQWQSLSWMRKEYRDMPESERKWKYSGFTSFEQEEACAG